MYWLDVIGIGEGGYSTLSSQSRHALETAEVIIGGERHHALAPQLAAERLRWPSPFSKMIHTVVSHRPRKTALLVTGDPLWYSAGAKLLGRIPLDEVRFHPQLSAFQLACARMGWSLADIETLTAHGRPMEQIIPYVQPGAQLAVLTSGSDAAFEAAQLLVDSGFGNSQITVLASLGGPTEKRLNGIAAKWAVDDPTEMVPAFHTLCIECIADQFSRVLLQDRGLPDDAFETDGNFTKREVRAIVVCMLAPQRGGLLWDIGTGCGTVAIEWMRAARDSRAIGIEKNSKRVRLAKRNAKKLGAPALKLIEGTAPEALDGLPQPDAIFIGGGLSQKTVVKAVENLRPFGRLVANAVTLESEAILIGLERIYGGELIRIAVSHAESLGKVRGWRSQMPVTQWRFVK